jgi:integrase
LAISI